MELGWGLSQYLPIVIYVSSIAVIILTIAYRIEFGIFYFVFFLPLQNVLEYAIIYPLGKDLNDLLLIAMIVKWALNKTFSKEPLFVKTPLNIPIILLAIWTYFSVWNGASYIGAPPPITPNNPLFVMWKNYMIAPILFLIIVNNVKDEKTRKIIVLIMVFSILVLDRNFYNIIRYKDTSHYSSSLTYIGRGSSLSGNGLAVFLAQYVIILVVLFLSDRNKWRKILYIGASALSYYCILFLFSRSGYLAAAASILVVGFIKEKKILVAAVLVVLLYSYVIPQAVRERIEMTRTEDGFDATSVQRLRMWEQGKLMISESPVIGWGFGITSQIVVKAEGFDNHYWTSFHNNYLQTVVETGFIGLFFVMLTFFFGVVTGFRLYRNGKSNYAKGLGLGLVACVFATLAGNIAGSYWQYYTMSGYYWTLLALVCGYLRDGTSQKREIEVIPLHREYDKVKKEIPEVLVHQ